MLGGVYFRMGPRWDKFRSRMNLEIRGHVLTLRIPRYQQHTAIDLEMRDVAVTQDSFTLDWTPHNANWGREGRATFQLVVRDGVRGLLENGQHVWKYSTSGEDVSDNEAAWEVVVDETQVVVDETPA